MTKHFSKKDPPEDNEKYKDEENKFEKYFKATKKNQFKVIKKILKNKSPKPKLKKLIKLKPKKMIKKISFKIEPIIKNSIKN